MSCRAMWTDAKKIDQPAAAAITRQGSIFSLTFDEIQSTMGGIGNGGKDFGSMNMEEFLKNLWTAEECQAMAATTVGNPNTALQRQGSSLTIPRTLSVKTVDDVWQDLMMCDNGENDGNRSDFQQQPRQPSLGEMTLEEFLVRAGVVKEEMKPMAKPAVSNNNNTSSTGGVYYGDMSMSGNSNGPFSISFSQVDQSNVAAISKPLSGNSGTNLAMFTPGGVIGQYAAATIPLVSQQGMGAVGMVDQVTNTGGTGVLGLGSQPVVNQITYEGFVAKGNEELSSLSPGPYVLGGEMRGRKSNGAVEKVVERRQRRMIKNRESAARSRARKQAYTMELEAEIAKLKEENQELQMKQVEQLEKQKKQVLEHLNQQLGPKKLCLRRTQTGRW